MPRTWNDQAANDFASAFLRHVRAVCPATPDTRTDADQIAEHIVPGNSLDCAAVFQREEGPWPYATNSNGNGNTHGLTVAVAKVHRPEIGMHAEMVLLDALPDADYFGISKRCCLLCANALRIANVGSRGNRVDLWDAWLFPAYIKNHPERLEAFLGAKAHEIYMSLSERGRASALRLIETNLKQYDD